MKKLLWKTLAVLIVLLVVLFLSLNLIARFSVEYGAKKITGFPLQVGSVNLRLFSSKVDVHNILLKNPAEFQEPLFVNLPQLYIDYRLGSMFSGRPHINDMLIEIKTLTIVKNAKGESNAAKLKGVLSSGDSSSKYTIDRLRLKIKGEVIIKDFSKPKPTERHIGPLDLEPVYVNVTESTPITRLVLMTVASQVKLPDIGVKVEDLKKGLEGVGQDAGKAAQGLFENIKKSLDGK